MPVLKSTPRAEYVGLHPEQQTIACFDYLHDQFSDRVSIATSVYNKREYTQKYEPKLLFLQARNGIIS